MVVMERRSRSKSAAASVRAGLAHPVVDADGHWQEPTPLFLDYFRDEVGSDAADLLAAVTGGFYTRWYEASPARRQELRIPRAPWWAEPSGTLDRATSMLPGLLYDRLDEFGIDVALMYPSLGLFGLHIGDGDVRAAFARAANRMAIEAFAPYSDRLIPVGLVAHRTPDEAVRALDDAVAMGFRAIFTTGALRRETVAGVSYIDFLGLDSPYDYDGFWQRCVDHGVAVTAHGGSIGWPDRLSPTNSVFNHVGHFANASDGFCKALVLGGVPARFPSLRFAFLEGGVSWACQLYADLVAHWKTRNASAVLEHLRPANLDPQRLRELFGRYDSPLAGARFEELLASTSPTRPFMTLEELTAEEQDLDEFGAGGVRSPDDLTEWFEKRFFFGCESDDPMAAVAFDARSGVRLRAMFGSDIGHFDVPDMASVLPEAYELVERGSISEADFEAFVFTNAVQLHTANNPGFFDGTIIEHEVTASLAG
jgi:predicted TIM-barrel fold metal-dependent hydrolase